MPLHRDVTLIQIFFGISKKSLQCQVADGFCEFLWHVGSLLIFARSS